MGYNTAEICFVAVVFEEKNLVYRTDNGTTTTKKK